eukprot:TRINITY_DN25010_c0_g1_i2.p1 TRINITY_DN25010_c0_g1~~TRINITY_DN25010_c0_g1_i2.p1  ORF type:complete len:698 (+),score=112.18 TRINITY_DN25010_c0_g1_i2:48-2141(+)
MANQQSSSSVGLKELDLGIGGCLTVSQLAVPHEKLPCFSNATQLRDVAEQLCLKGLTAAVIFSPDGVPRGLVTEDDILQLYLQGAPWDITVGEMCGNGSEANATSSTPRRPCYDLPGFASISHDHLIPEALQLVTPLPGASVRGLSHLLVERACGYGGGVISPLDLVQAFADHRLAMRSGDDDTTALDIMEPLQHAPCLNYDCTMQKMVRELLAYPGRAVIMSSKTGLKGLATVRDALRGFYQQAARSKNAWEMVAMRPGSSTLQQHVISSAASIRDAATMMVSTPTGASACLRDLIVVRADTTEVIGILTPLHLVHALAAKPTSSLNIAATRQLKNKAMEVHPSNPRKRRRHETPIKLRPITIADLVVLRDHPICTTSQTLSDAAHSLVDSGRTACLVVSGQGEVQGVFTENDLLAALVEGTMGNLAIEKWLRGGNARLPGFLVPALTLPATSSLAEAAVEMTAVAEEYPGFACHHLLVCQSSSDSSGHEKQIKILSALDIAMGLIDAVAVQTAGSDAGAAGNAAVETAAMTVQHAMKERCDVSCCRMTDTLDEAFRTMFDSHQNCVLVESESESSHAAQPSRDAHGVPAKSRVVDVITSNDAILVLAARQTNKDAQGSSIAGWLEKSASVRKTIGDRAIVADAHLFDAARAMALSESHHLMVLAAPGSEEITGVISALDVVCALGANYRFDLVEL